MEKYDTIFVDERESAAFINPDAMYKLAELAKFLPQETSLTTDIDDEDLPGLLKEASCIYDERAGSFAVYLRGSKGLIKISVEPKSLEELTGIEVAEEIKVKDFGGLVRKIRKLRGVGE